MNNKTENKRSYPEPKVRCEYCRELRPISRITYAPINAQTDKDTAMCDECELYIDEIVL